MSDTRTFFVSGVPIPQGSMMLVRAGGTHMIHHRSHALKAWRSAIAWAARAACKGPMLEGALILSATFYLPRPRTVKRAVPNVKPDLSKLVRALEDGLTGVLWKDDSQVVMYRELAKVYALSPVQCGVRVTVDVL